MNSTTYNAQFLTIDFRLLDSSAFCAFMRSAAFPVYMLLRRYVWRSAEKRHPVDQVNELYREGFLVASVPRKTLAEKLDLLNVATVSRHLAELARLGVVRTVKTGRQNVYVLGTWEDRSLAGDGSYLIELFLLEQLHGAEPFDRPRRDDVAPGLPETRTPRRATAEVTPTATAEVTPTITAEVTSTVTAEVAKPSHSNKETNREANSSGDLPFYMLPVGPEATPIPFADPPRSAAPGRPPRDPPRRSGSRPPSHLRLVRSERELDHEPKYPVLTVRL